MILKTSLLTELEKKIIKILRKAIIFLGVGSVLGGKVGARQTNIFKGRPKCIAQ